MIIINNSKWTYVGGCKIEWNQNELQETNAPMHLKHSNYNVQVNFSSPKNY